MSTPYSTAIPLPPALAERLQSADAGVRRVAVLELADHEEEAWLPALVYALQDPDANVRLEAAQRLAGWDEPTVVTGLAERLLDEDSGVKQAATQSLSELKNPASASALLPWARHDDAFARAAALRALRELRVSDAIPAALEGLAHSHPAVRRESVGVLGWLKHRAALDSLAALAQTDADAEVRRAAVGALGLAAEADHATITSALVAALNDAAWQVREEAASTLGKLRIAALEPLVGALQDEFWQVRLRAARSLGRVQALQAVPALGGLLTHDISNLRKEVVIALGEIGGVTAQALLQATLQDKDPEVRKLARLGLARQGVSVCLRRKPLRGPASEED